MRYWKGSIALSSTQDVPLLRQVLRSTFVSHNQLYEFLRLEFCAASRNAYNNRLLRLVKNDYLIRDNVRFRNEVFVYSITERGAAELIGLGECYAGPIRRAEDGTPPKAVRHALDLNEIHLALKRSQQLVQWTPESEIRSRNEFTATPYKKDYDAIVTVKLGGADRRFALEYERTAKPKQEYKKIREEIDGELQVDRFLYLLPNYDVLAFVARSFETSRRLIYFGLLTDFLRYVVETPLRRARPGAMVTLKEALQLR